MDSPEDRELQQRLVLFQLFSQLYEHHRGLLDDILRLETPSLRLPARTGGLNYMQAIVLDNQGFLVTNLLTGSSCALTQAQQIWIIGRDPNRVSLCLRDKRLSRCHAALQCLPTQEFVLTDLGSTNGSFVNGERIRHQSLLRDGDCVRLGSVTFSFFICRQFEAALPPPPDLLAQLQQLTQTMATGHSIDDITVMSGLDGEDTCADGAQLPSRALEQTVQLLRSHISRATTDD
ncbi:adenylate/guanylate cyclase domain protein [Halomicronema hongdechloris C2206]|uniref:Adenylate/guanylate cyclase domain protein n=1 Tax=Halomicronema hongdechloris C2206 TaxID=1641165 RepID=A0A1Z3HI94_9CYAN|nr:FHA domain-containing protein [Halomicronema hongdechloris]ASC70008.1 adenylate/guanylate cyclase domain protein [Halomicronema hongdechloris C2206]